MPKVTVCIPTYNRIHLLPVALESVLGQTEQDFELIVCDDGSTDGTANLMVQYQDSRIRYIRHAKNIGKSNNMRSGFEAAKGKYFIKFDDDDRLTPDFLSRTTVILEQDDGIDFVGTDHWIININGVRDEPATKFNSQHWGRANLSEGLVENLLEVVFVKQSFQIGATLFRRQALQEVGFMRPNMQNCEDNDLLVRLALAGKKGYYLPELLMEYRCHAEQQGTNRAIIYLQDKLRYLENFEFESKKLENIRRSRLAESQLMLGLRLIETGETQKGRQLVQASTQVLGNSPRVTLGLILSYLPVSLRQLAFQGFRQIRPKDYVKRVREAG
ncbi:MAG: glycosyltransferase family 2 protein [Xenococcaceae cyanobacterium]